MGEITVITSGKGGVGKSTVSAGIGAALARRGKRVLLVDGDVGLRSLDLILGISPQLVFDIADVMMGNCEPLEAVYECPTCPNLFLLPAPRSAEYSISPELMQRLVYAMSKVYDHVLMDCPAGLGRGFFSAIAPATSALIVATTDPVSLQDARQASRALQKEGMDRQRLIINRFNRNNFRKMRHYRDLDEVVDAAGVQLIGIVPEDFEVQVGYTRGIALTSRCLGGKALQNIATRLEGEDVPLLKALQ